MLTAPQKTGEGYKLLFVPFKNEEQIKELFRKLTKRCLDISKLRFMTFLLVNSIFRNENFFCSYTQILVSPSSSLVEKT